MCLFCHYTTSWQFRFKGFTGTGLGWNVWFTPWVIQPALNSITFYKNSGSHDGKGPDPSSLPADKALVWKCAASKHALLSWMGLAGHKMPFKTHPSPHPREWRRHSIFFIFFFFKSLCPKIAVQSLCGLTLLNNHMNLLIQPFLILWLTEPTVLPSLFVICEIKRQVLCMLSFAWAVRGLAQLWVQ